MQPYAPSPINETPFDMGQVGFVAAIVANSNVAHRASSFPQTVALEPGTDTQPRPTDPMPNTAKAIATDYAKRLHVSWPEAQTYYRCSGRDKAIRLMVIGNNWDFDKEYDAFHLRSQVWPEDLPEDWYIEVDVWFADKGTPDLTLYMLVS